MILFLTAIVVSVRKDLADEIIEIADGLSEGGLRILNQVWLIARVAWSTTAWQSAFFISKFLNSMKENLKNKSSLSFRAIEALALKASALAEVRNQRNQLQRNQLNQRNELNQAAPVAAAAKRNKQGRASAHQRNLSKIESDMRAIFRLLSSEVEDGSAVVTSQSGKGESARWTASVFRQEDLCRQKEEEVLHCPNPFKATPVVKYVFYPDTLRPDRLGSVAIYGEGASLRKAAIDRAGQLFGHRVAFTSLEMGRRLFVDVRFAV